MTKGFDEYKVTAGDVIRGERATLGLDLDQVSQKLCIPIRLIMNIEQGVFSDEVPAHLMNNIVRDYANFLRLDPVEIRAMYWNEVEAGACKSVQTESDQKQSIENKRSAFSKLMSKLGLRPQS
ncbi:MAG: helix-turn-helix domain-containing protein [Yoonia sp.]